MLTVSLCEEIMPLFSWIVDSATWIENSSAPKSLPPLPLQNKQASTFFFYSKGMTFRAASVGYAIYSFLKASRASLRVSKRASRGSTRLSTSRKPLNGVSCVPFSPIRLSPRLACRPTQILASVRAGLLAGEPSAPEQESLGDRAGGGASFLPVGTPGHADVLREASHYLSAIKVCDVCRPR